MTKTAFESETRELQDSLSPYIILFGRDMLSALQYHVNRCEKRPAIAEA